MDFNEARKFIPGVLLLVALVLGTIVAAPFIFRGAPSNAHDIEFHINTWLELSRDLAQTQTYPQWAEGANFGLGEPRFVFYPPLSLVAGAVLSDIFPLRMVPGVFAFLCAVLAAMSMWKLATAFVSPRWALLAAAFYVLNPYFLLTAYLRGAYAELLLAGFAPIVLLAVIRTTENSWRWTAVLAVTYGLAWMTNLPGALLLSYALVGLAALICARQGSWRPFIRVVAGLALGIGVAASFITPLLQERVWVQSDSVVSCPTCVQDNFLFTHHREKEPEHQQFNRHISIAISFELAIAALALLLLARARRFNDPAIFALSVLVIASAVLLFKPSVFLWQYLPKLRFVQFPWRVAFVLNCALAILVVAALRVIPRLPRFGIAVILLVPAVLFPWLWIPSWEPLDFAAITAQFPSGYEGVQEYAPERLNDVNEVPRGLPPIDLGGCTDTLRTDQAENGVRYSCGSTTALVEQWNARTRLLRFDTAEPATITILQYWFPTWKLYVNGKPASIDPPTDDLPFVHFNIPAGISEVQLHDETTTAKKLARILSAFSLLIAVIIFARDRRSEPSINHSRSPEFAASSN